MKKDDYLSKVYSNLSRNMLLRTGKIGNTEVILTEGGNLKSYWSFFPMIFFTPGASVKVAIGYTEKVSEKALKEYSLNVLKFYCKDNHHLWTYGPFIFSLIVSENVSDEAKRFAEKAPPIRFFKSEIPMVFDLSENKLYYFKRRTYGYMYNKGIRKFIRENFIP
jgi:hypothetical protein